MFVTRSLAFAVLATISFGFSASVFSAEKALPGNTVATVNGQPISEASVNSIAQQLANSGEPVNLDQILDELINLEVLTQAAEASELEKSPEVAAALQLQYNQTMANAYLARKGATMTFSEAELRAEFEAQSASVDRAEYRASHILLETEQDAAKVLSELALGKTFDELAKTYSIDPAGENGGDLGWFQSTTLPPEFTSAVAKMKIGEVSQAPVKTEFGYHIIKLVDSRQVALPDFESVKPGLSNLAVRKALANHVQELRSAADIQTN